MSTVPALEVSALAIVEEVGGDLSYFTPADERNFLHLPIMLGQVLLTWYLEGVRLGVHEQVSDLGKSSVQRLAGLVRKLFSKRDEDPEARAAAAEQVGTEAGQALAAARAALGTEAPVDVSGAMDAYAENLVGYLTGEGMPVRDAVRIAQRVRREVRLQLGIAEASA